MQNAKLPDGTGTGTAINPAQRGDALIPADGAGPGQVGAAKVHVRFGVLQGQAWIADDFDAPLPAYLLDAFEGR
ncbi:hypothetical protein C7H84_24020 [Burkholderia sp. Nafp2/4-1b]|uniref:hypothetical protein n=1 Tax=Burkholderia sp. Nafp2/4-1b TaxID=2116686 RepID=UPI000EF87CA7|nr:hypothetical protein [Burkholderia sp. Nafp2/4-1b]RKU00744.1 hypothetical protein C7H84_24020 [Burkholderia sp. Nafp2/4-1b]